jgi:hypothetical protein
LRADAQAELIAEHAAHAALVKIVLEEVELVVFVLMNMNHQKWQLHRGHQKVGYLLGDGYALLQED